MLEELVISDNKYDKDEIELLDLLIEKWDAEHNSLLDVDPITMLKSLMEEKGLKSKDLVNILGLTKGTISKILNYHKGLSKETIRELANYFKISQEAFNRPYKLVNEVNRRFHNARLMNTKKDMGNRIVVKKKEQLHARR